MKTGQNFYMSSELVPTSEDEARLSFLFAVTRPALKSSALAKPTSGQIVVERGGAYELNERQAKHFEECIATERKPGTTLKEAARQYKAKVISK